MKKRLLALMLTMSAVLSYSTNTAADDTTKEARFVVERFQKVPANILFCDHDRWDADPELALPIMRGFLSNEMLHLYSWIQCSEPSYIRPLDKERYFRWDFRYGTQAQGGSDYVKNIRIRPTQAAPGKQVQVQVLWDNGDIKNTWARYTLIREDGQWRIDDIALKGYSSNVEEYLPGTKSLKTELQAAYKRAEAKCLQEPKCKTKMSK